ncbi:MAG: ribbon-helix-helix domain-containing protein [Alphaproteobacteria bacterium]|nr:ribbon-helix-helix domain-containing protein [Alphaproteobacteria bacterium]
MRSTLVSRNVTVAGNRTSVRLEPEMWDGLQEICRRERVNMHQICTAVSGQKRAATSLTAAIRVFIMRYFRQAATEDGHNKAGHGYGMAIGINPTRLPSHNPPPLRATGMAAFHKTSFA